MTDLNERSFSAGNPSDNAAAQRAATTRSKLAAPLWRFRAGLQPVSVVRTLKTKIIPRLFFALKPAADAAVADVSEQPAVHDPVIAFAALTLVNDDNAASNFVDALLAQGISVETVFLNWLAPAARQLGEQWETDETDFANVTIGVTRLQRIMRQLGDDFCGEQPHADGGSSMLLTVVPGEQHSFGLSMVAEFFRRAGWNLCTGPFDSHRELTSLVHNHWFDVVGFSVSSDRRLEDLKRDIEEIRRSSRNRQIGILLGGPMMIDHPELVAALGADMMSIDATTAPQSARSLIDQMKGHA